jgi:hypothetical protein
VIISLYQKVKWHPLSDNQENERSKVPAKPDSFLQIHWS